MVSKVKPGEINLNSIFYLTLYLQNIIFLNHSIYMKPFLLR